jgi:hypothetical protein
MFYDETPFMHIISLATFLLQPHNKSSPYTDHDKNNN